MLADGALVPEVLEVEGLRLPATNFVNADHASGELRLWVSVSTRQVPREQAFRRETWPTATSCSRTTRGTRIVADGLGFTNENKLDPSGRFLYVNETMARRLSRFPIRDDASLGAARDGRRVRRRHLPGRLRVRCRGRHLDRERGQQPAAPDRARRQPAGHPRGQRPGGGRARSSASIKQSALERADIDAGRARPLGNLASVAFGGPDLRTVYLGSLFAPRIATFRSRVAGADRRIGDY